MCVYVYISVYGARGRSSLDMVVFCGNLGKYSLEKYFSVWLIKCELNIKYHDYRKSSLRYLFLYGRFPVSVDEENIAVLGRESKRDFRKVDVKC